MKAAATLLLSILLATSAWAMTPAEKRLEEAQLLKDLLEKQSTVGNARAEAMMRLGTLYVEHGHQLEGDDGETWIRRGIHLYEDVLKGYRFYEGRAQTQYRLGAALVDVGEGQRGRQLLEGVLKEHPDTVYIPYVHYELGEHYFDERNLYKAITSYRKARAFPQFEDYAHSTFKLAWCYYNAADFGQAVATMREVPTLGEAVGATKPLKADAMRDLARFYADADLYDEGYAYFRDNGDTDNLKVMLERMAARYERSGDQAGLKKVKKVLEKEFPS